MHSCTNRIDLIQGLLDQLEQGQECFDLSDRCMITPLSEITPGNPQSLKEFSKIYAARFNGSEYSNSSSKPHIFEMMQRAYRHLKVTGQDQTIAVW